MKPNAKQAKIQDASDQNYEELFALISSMNDSFFNYNNQTYKQIHGCAMGSPVKADFQSSHEAPRSSLRVHASN
jgi:hypothetical protein